MQSTQKTFFIITLSTLIALPILAAAKSTNARSDQGQPEATASVVISPSSSSSSNGADEDLDHGAKNWKDKVQEFKDAKESQRIERLKELGAMLIENRISLLNNLKTRIQNMNRLTDAEKTALILDIDTNIADLNTLKTKIAADTDLVTLKADVKSIFEKFRIYMVAAPKGLGETLASQGQYILGRLQAIQRQMEQVMNQNKNQGKDTTQLEQLMTQVTNQLQTAEDQLAIAEEKFKSMTPANTDAAKTAREEGKAAMKKAKDALKEAHRILKQISEQLKTMGATSPSPLTSVSPTILPSATPTPSPSAS